MQIAAASTALILGHDKRKNGRWVRNSIIQNSGLQGSAERESLRCAGLVLDELGPAHLCEIRDGDASLAVPWDGSVLQGHPVENQGRVVLAHWRVPVPGARSGLRENTGAG